LGAGAAAASAADADAAEKHEKHKPKHPSGCHWDTFKVRPRTFNCTRAPQEQSSPSGVLTSCSLPSLSWAIPSGVLLFCQEKLVCKAAQEAAAGRPSSGHSAPSHRAAPHGPADHPSPAQVRATKGHRPLCAIAQPRVWALRAWRRLVSLSLSLSLSLSNKTLSALPPPVRSLLAGGVGQSCGS
jgi:hypothetical protein